MYNSFGEQGSQLSFREQSFKEVKKKYSLNWLILPSVYSVVSISILVSPFLAFLWCWRLVLPELPSFPDDWVALEWHEVLLDEVFGGQGGVALIEHYPGFRTADLFH